EHFVAHGSRERERIRSRAHEERHAVYASLRKRHVNLRADFVRNTLLPDVADDTDNRAAQTIFTTKRHPLSECITLREETLRKRLVDDRYLLPLFTVARVVVTTIQQRDLH